MGWTRNNNLKKGGEGFTLIELLIVIAITSVLVSLLMVPLFRSFEITEKTQLAIRAQEACRQTMEQLTREIQSAIYVYDNSGSALNIPVVDPSNQTARTFQIPYAVIDLVLPKTVMHCNSSAHNPANPRDYSRDDGAGNVYALRPCPFDGSEDVEERTVTPIAPSDTIVRYFIGLKYPDRPYRSAPENANLATDPNQDDNTFVLYRAEFKLTIPDPNDATKMIPNTDLFDVDGSGNLLWQPIQAPNFFYNSLHVENWKRIAKVVGPTSSMDLINLRLDQATGALTGVSSLVQFVPNSVSNDVMTPTELGRTAQGDPTAPPTVYRATQGMWGTTYQVRLIRQDPSSGDITDVFYTDPDNPAKIHKTVTGNPVTDPVIFDGDAFNATGAITSGADVMFLVDPNRGQVNFALPRTRTITHAEVQTINSDYLTSIAAKEGAGLRKFTLPEFTAANIPNLRVCPGSERIVGPDYAAGQNYGKPVMYSRVSLLTEDPGPNQYRINNKTGDITFASANVPIPETDISSASTTISVTYSIQNNMPYDSRGGDILSADYKSKNTVALQIAYKLYDAKGKPQSFRIANTVFVHNFHR